MCIYFASSQNFNASICSYSAPVYNLTASLSSGLKLACNGINCGSFCSNFLWCAIFRGFNRFSTASCRLNQLCFYETGLHTGLKVVDYRKFFWLSIAVEGKQEINMSGENTWQQDKFYSPLGVDCIYAALFLNWIVTTADERIALQSRSVVWANEKKSILRWSCKFICRRHDFTQRGETLSICNDLANSQNPTTNNHRYREMLHRHNELKLWFYWHGKWLMKISIAIRLRTSWIWRWSCKLHLVWVFDGPHRFGKPLIERYNCASLLGSYQKSSSQGGRWWK